MELLEVLMDPNRSRVQTVPCENISFVNGQQNHFGRYWQVGTHEGRMYDATLDPDTLALLRRIVDDAHATYPVALQVEKQEIAERVLKSATAGERDRLRLRTAAFVRFSK